MVRTETNRKLSEAELNLKDALKRLDRIELSDRVISMEQEKVIDMLVEFRIQAQQLDSLNTERVRLEAIVAETKDRQFVPECSVCMEKPAKTTFVDCGHVVCCIECSGKMNGQCPLCRRRSYAVIELFI